MTVPVRLEDGSGGTSIQAKISIHGEVITRAFDYSLPSSHSLDVANTAVNFVKPRSNHFFIMTAIVLSANSKVDNVDGTLVTIYQSDGEDSLTEIGEPTIIHLARNSNTTIVPISLKTGKGVYINMKHDDTTPNAEVFGTIMGYFIPADGFEIDAEAHL